MMNLTEPVTTKAKAPKLIASNGKHHLWAIDDVLLDDAIFIPCLAKEPGTGKEFAAISISKGGLVLMDPVARTKRHIRSETYFSNAWLVSQGPKGYLYQVDFGAKGMVTCWDWKSEKSKIIGYTTSKSPFDVVGAEDCLYIVDYGKNQILRFDVETGVETVLVDFKGHNVGHHIRLFNKGADGMLYCNVYTYANQGEEGSHLVMVDPKTKKITDMTAQSGRRFSFARTADGRALIGTMQYGRQIWRELINGQVKDVDQRELKVTSTGSSLVFSDGSYVEEMKEWSCTVVQKDGQKHTIDIRPEGSPIRLFSVASAFNKVWVGTFIPLRLVSYDPFTENTTYYGNPTPVTGEIYELTHSGDNLYMCSYTQCWLTRFNPHKPMVVGSNVLANPGQLGLMKEGSLPLQRSYGVAKDNKERVYFAALGGYGCVDSGISRIDPSNGDEVTRWIFPRTKFEAMTYLKSTHQLLISEVRLDEMKVRFTLINADTGEIEWSQIIKDDPDGVVSWVADEEGRTVVGMHAYRATFYKFDVQTRTVTHKLEEVRVGQHCHNALIQGPDGRIWGYTRDHVYAVDWDLKSIESIFDFTETGHYDAYRFGFCKGPDGCLYFPDGKRLLRIETR